MPIIQTLIFLHWSFESLGSFKHVNFVFRCLERKHMYLFIQNSVVDIMHINEQIFNQIA